MANIYEVRPSVYNEQFAVVHIATGTEMYYHRHYSYDKLKCDEMEELANKDYETDD